MCLVQISLLVLTFLSHTIKEALVELPQPIYLYYMLFFALINFTLMVEDWVN